MVKVNDVCVAYTVPQISYCCSILLPTPFPFDSHHIMHHVLKKDRLLFSFLFPVRI